MNNGILAQSLAYATARITQEGRYGVVAAFSDVMAEYSALRRSVGLCDFSTHGKFKITGDDYVRWLSELVSRDLEFFDTEKTLFALCLNEQGEALDLVTLYKYEDAILVETEASNRDRLADWFEQHRTDAVVIEDVSEELALIGFEGPQAFKVARMLIDFEISSIPFQSFVETTKDGQLLTLARIGSTGEYGYKVFAPAEYSACIMGRTLCQSLRSGWQTMWQRSVRDCHARSTPAGDTGRDQPSGCA